MGEAIKQTMIDTPSDILKIHTCQITIHHPRNILLPHDRKRQNTCSPLSVPHILTTPTIYTTPTIPTHPPTLPHNHTPNQPPCPFCSVFCENKYTNKINDFKRFHYTIILLYMCVPFCSCSYVFLYITYFVFPVYIRSIKRMKNLTFFDITFSLYYSV